ncbi:MAG TPA: hypothetical protein VMV18_07465 [bacterium]|nr:hypothetical protein [bacterium]
MKALKGTALVLGVMSLTACGQGFTPSADDHVAAPQGGGTVFTNGQDNTVYQTASYATLRSVITDVMLVSDTPNASVPTADCAAAALTANACPKWQPLAYLAANAGSLGAPVYNSADPTQTQAPGPISSGGIKAWILASSSASGLMMTQATPALFPKGINDYTYLYNALVGRNPTDVEIQTLNQLEADIAAKNPSMATAQLTQRQGAAVATAVLGSMEFLMVN